jgi:hypothetical protein
MSEAVRRAITASSSCIDEMNLLQTIKRFWWVALLAVGAQPAWGFALLGPLANGGDSWQTGTIGYGLAYTEYLYPGGPVNLGDIGGPKNLAEEYRRNTPVIYYTYDANFLDYFGSNGVAAVDSAFAIINQAFTTNPMTGEYLTNGVDSFSDDLSEYPPESLHINYEAQSLALTDLKSVTLHALVEQLGLAEPERFTWTLAERIAPPGCPFTTLYLVVQRNYPVSDSLFNQVQYSSYVNDTLYTYYILEICSGPSPLAITVPYNVDPYADVFTAVAANNADGLGIGGYYTGLTRDDMAGLRYLYSANNRNWETAAFIGQNGPALTSSAGNSGIGAANLLVTNALPQQIITTQPLGPLLAAAEVDDPATLQALFPGLVIASSSNTLSLSIETNYFAYYTNQPGPDVTNYAGSQILVSQDFGLLLARAATNDPATLESFYPDLMVSTVTNEYAVSVTTNITASYTNQPGPSLTNFLPTLSTNATLDFGLLLQRAAADDPATLVALYPGLVVATTTNLAAVITTNITAYYTNQPGPDVTNYLKLFSTNTTSNLGLLLQQAAADDPATLQALNPGLVFSTVTNDAIAVITTNITAYYTNQPGLDVTNFLPLYLTNATSDYGLLLQAMTNDPATLQALYPGLVFSTVTNDPIVVVTTNITAYYTNQPYIPGSGTNATTVTNLGTVQLLNPPPNNMVPPPITSGTIDFGLFTMQALTNNTGEITDPATAIAQLQALYPGLVILSATPDDDLTEVVTTNYVTTVSTRIGAPVGSPPIQVTSIDSLYTNYVQRYTYEFGNLMLDSNGTFYPFVDYVTSTNLYNTNETVTIQTISTTNLIGAPVGSPQMTNITTTTAQIYGVTGDFFIMPTNWCGFTIKKALVITVLKSYTNTVTAAGTTNTVAGSFTNASAQWTQNTIHTYTNRQFQIWPGICEPLLQFATNVTTNVVITYLNTPLNVYIYTNSLTSQETVITNMVFTTNGAPWGILYTNAGTNIITLPVPTGDYFFVPTNWCWVQVVSNLLTGVVYYTNTTLTAGPAPIFSAPGGVLSGVAESYSQTVITSFTNHVLRIRQGICEPILQFSTNYTTNVVITYQNTLLNVYTNNYTNISYATVLTTNIFTTNGALLGTLFTNSPPPPPSGPTNLGMSVIALTNVPTGDYFLIPTSWCGVTIVSTQLTSVVYATNSAFALQTPLVGAPGLVESFSQSVITTFTNHNLVIRQAICEPILQFVTNYTTNVVITYSNTLMNVYTNTYSATSQETVLTTNIFTTNGALVGTLFTNSPPLPPSGPTNLGTSVITTTVPAGDFLIIPTNWCWFRIVTNSGTLDSNLLTTVVYTTNTTFALQTPLVGAPGVESYSQAVITAFTNHNLVIQQGICEPELIFYTNYTTNVVITYQNTLLNVYTNYYAPTSTVTVVVTNIGTTNGALVGTLVTNSPLSVTLVTNLPTGDFFIVPTNWCGFRFITSSNGVLTNVVYQTNTILTATIPPGMANIGQQYSQTLYGQYTNHTFIIQPGFCIFTLVFGTNYTTNIVTTYQYTFANVYTNFYAPTSTVTVVTTNIYATNGSLFGILTTNVGSTNYDVDLPTGDFFIIPANWCSFSIVATLLTNVSYATNFSIATATTILTITNTIYTNGISTNSTVSVSTNVQQYSVSIYASSTNHTFLIQPEACSLVPFATGLRPGIERVQFVKASYDSLLGRTFQPITNYYTMQLINDSQVVTQFFQRVVLAPDILLTAANDIAANTFDGSIVRNIVFDEDNIGAGLAGPGTINPRTTISYNKIGNAYENGFPFTVLGTNAFVLEASQMPVLQWASFDASTNDPVVYPDGDSIANMEKQVLIQVLPPPPTLPDGATNAAYASTFSVANGTGGAFTPPFTWGLASGSLPAGLYWTNSLPGAPNDTIAGTPPLQAGTFDFTVQLTDYLGRSVNWNYTITIH